MYKGLLARYGHFNLGQNPCINLNLFFVVEFFQFSETIYRE